MRNRTKRNAEKKAIDTSNALPRQLLPVWQQATSGTIEQFDQWFSSIEPGTVLAVQGGKILKGKIKK